MLNAELVEAIEENHFTVAKIQGQPVLVTNALMLGPVGSEWEGSAVFSQGYLMDLFALSLAHQILSLADVRQVMDKAFAYTKQHQQQRDELARRRRRQQS
ncbi:hypothetical protein HZU77_008735 [Neisseriaceae bacterium TC5R-5]|nr:hypothetical protein [Neisseriaceae bacterium TC5R-5]